MRSALIVGVLVTAAALQATEPRASAETFLYNYSFYDPGAVAYYKFSYESPSLITTDQPYLTPSSCTAYGYSCDQVGILAASGEVRIYGANQLTDPGLPPSFFQVGSHVNGFATMEITENVGASSVPEPSTLALAGSGLLAFTGQLRRRCQRRHDTKG